MNKLKVGLVGAGLIGKKRSKVIQDDAEAIIVGVADPNLEAIGSLPYDKTEYSVYADWKDLLAITIYIVDIEGTFLDSISVTSDSRSTRLYRIGLPTNIGSYLAIRIRHATTSGSGGISIHSVQLNTHRVGRLALE